MNIGRPDHWTHALLSEELVELFNQMTNRVLSREHPSNLVYYTIIENPKKVMVSAKFFGAAYSRPEEVSVASPKLAWLSLSFSLKHTH